MKKKTIKRPVMQMESKKDLERQVAQLSLNCRWLIQQTDEIHFYLCPDKIGTWQQRAEFAVETAKKISEKGE